MPVSARFRNTRCVRCVRAGEKKKPGGYLLSRLIGSIIGARELDFRVRDGNGYCLSAMATGQNESAQECIFRPEGRKGKGEGRTGRGHSSRVRGGQYGQASRPISTARLNALPRLDLQPINRIVCPGSSGETGSRG